MTSGDLWEFRTSCEQPKGLDVKQAEVLADANQLTSGDKISSIESLPELVRSIRERRRRLKSVIERIDDREQWTSRDEWFQRLTPSAWAMFWWQGNANYRADASGFFSPRDHKMIVGCDGILCWNRNDNRLSVGPADSIDYQNVSIADPYFAGTDASDEAVIKELSLKNSGFAIFNDRKCHRLTSSTLNPSKDDPNRTNVREWLFDAETLLPVLYDGSFWHEETPIHIRYETTYISIDEKIPAEIFQPPKIDGLIPTELEPLKAGYENRFLNAIDVSRGRISVRWGEHGSAGTNSSGLN